METTKFISDFKKTLIERLNDYESGTYYACELAQTLFESENVNGSVYSTYQTKKFIKENFDLFRGLVEYCKDRMDITLNPFQEPEKAHVILLLVAGQSILSKLPTIEKNRNEKIELTPKMIKRLTKELKALEIENEDLF